MGDSESDLASMADEEQGAGSQHSVGSSSHDSSHGSKHGSSHGSHHKAGNSDSPRPQGAPTHMDASPGSREYPSDDDAEASAVDVRLDSPVKNGNKVVSHVGCTHVAASGVLSRPATPGSGKRAPPGPSPAAAAGSPRTGADRGHSSSQPHVYRSSIVQKRIAESRLTSRMSRGLNPLEDDYPTGPDSLAPKSRANYESIRFKIFLSVVYGALFCFALGLCAIAGSKGERYLDMHYALEARPGIEYIQTTLEHDRESLDGSQLGILTRAEGFACFCHLVAAALLLLAAVNTSPFFCGAIGEAARVTKYDHWARREPDGKYEQIVLSKNGKSTKLPATVDAGTEEEI